MVRSSPEAKNLEAISKAIDRHELACEYPTLAILMNPFEVERLGTMVSPVNWTFSIRNALVDWHAPNRLVERFSLGSPVSLGLFTLVGMAQQLFGRGELLEVVLRRPVDGVTGSSSDAR